jgi:hypothetical protein
VTLTTRATCVCNRAHPSTFRPMWQRVPAVPSFWWEPWFSSCSLKSFLVPARSWFKNCARTPRRRKIFGQSVGGYGKAAGHHHFWGDHVAEAKQPRRGGPRGNSAELVTSCARLTDGDCVWAREMPSHLDHPERSDLDRPERWRALAAEALETAKGLTDPTANRVMIAIAEAYLRQAQRAEERNHNPEKSK